MNGDPCGIACAPLRPCRDAVSSSGNPAGANTPPPAAGTFITSTVTYDDSTGPAATPGDPLEIHLLSRGEDPNSAGDINTFDVDFDAVTFTVTGP